MEEIASRNGFLKILLLLTVVSIKHVQCSHTRDINEYQRTLVWHLQLVHYKNPTGKTLRGDYLEGGTSPLIFTLYFSGSQRGDLGIFANTNPVGYIQDQVHYFGPDTEPKSIYNSKFRIQSNWTDGFTVELDVQKLYNNGLIVPYDNFKLVIQSEQYHQYDLDLESKSKVRPQASQLRINYYMATRCDRSVFYGPLCQVYCKAEDSDHGHYTCGQDGKKLCLPGWLYPDEDCKRPNECDRGYCKNNGNCSARESSKTYVCTCPMYFTGDQCETPTVDCTEDDKRMANCTNGGMCVIDRGTRKCNCPMEYCGTRCEELHDICKHYEPCKNGGSCKNVPGDHVCQCPIGVAGKNCENVCGRDIQCGNSGQLPGAENMDGGLVTGASKEGDNHGIQLLPGTAAVFLGVAAVAMASCLGL